MSRKTKNPIPKMGAIVIGKNGYEFLPFAEVHALAIDYGDGTRLEMRYEAKEKATEIRTTISGLTIIPCCANVIKIPDGGG